MAAGMVAFNKLECQPCCCFDSALEAGAHPSELYRGSDALPEPRWNWRCLLAAIPAKPATLGGERGRSGGSSAAW